MSINFEALGSNYSPDTVASPREIFSLLPSKAPKYQYLRDVQAEVLNQWFSRRAENHVVLKMNTGSGKTIVGLLALKSCLNEDCGPAVYIAPNPYLAQQVEKEAKDIGLETTDDVKSIRFLRGKAILITSVFKLINGRSVFGVGQEGIKIPIGSIVIDDAHSCLSISEDQFALTLPNSHPAYEKLLTLLESDLSQQSPSSTLDIKESDPSKYLLLPYWAWIDKQKEILAVLHVYRDDDELKFSWPLLVDHLALCRCVIGGDSLEITPYCIPISTIPSFGNAKRHIYMTAAFADDSVLVSDFDATPESIQNPITPSTAGDIGDRMILVPQEFNPEITDVELKKFYKQISKTLNVVVLVPSGHRAKFWSDVADQTLNATTLPNGVEELKRRHVGLVVLINKYDGIDLPDFACRVLVVDGLPDVRKKIDKIEQNCLDDSDLIVSQAIQRIEQGMGRGIRSNEDYCVVFLMGASLTNVLYSNRAIEKFTPATKAQFALSERLSTQIRGSGLKAIGDTIEYCLNRDIQWVSASRSATVQVRYASGGPLNQIPIHQRKAFNAAAKRDYQAAAAEIQQAVNGATDSKVKGWLLQQLGEYSQRLNPSEAQAIQKSALNVNCRITRPLEGIAYVKMSSPLIDQASQCISYLKENFPNYNNLIITVNAYIDAFSFRPDTAPLFEQTTEAIARLLGFQSQRPETETGRGPDVLWRIGGLSFLVIECKNGAITPTINKHDANQLTGSMNWFEEKYDNTCNAIPTLIHPSSLFERAGTPHPNTRVITNSKLTHLGKAIGQFAIGISHMPNYGSAKEVAELLDHLHLSSSKLIPMFSEKARLKT